MLALGGLFGMAPDARASTGVEPAADISDASVREVASAIDRLRTDANRHQSFGELTTLREQQRQFLRTHGKFPDFIEVGVDVWLTAYDWHVKHLQPMTIGRDREGRYTIMLMFTTLVMRTDQMLNYVGPPFDKS
jgi:hypothetical protein